MHDHREQVLTRADLDRERRERTLVRRDLVPVDEEGRRVVDAGELDPRPPAVYAEAAPVDPGALRHPLREPALPLEADVGHLAGTHDVVEDAARHARRQPARRVPRLVGADVPAPLLAEAAPHLPLLAVERYAGHSSRLVSTTGSASSRGTTNVLISAAPKSTSNVRPKTSKAARAGRPVLSYARTTSAPPPSSAPFSTVPTTPLTSWCDAACGSGPAWYDSSSANGGPLSSAASRARSAARQSPACGRTR